MGTKSYANIGRTGKELPLCTMVLLPTSLAPSVHQTIMQHATRDDGVNAHVMTSTSDSHTLYTYKSVTVL